MSITSLPFFASFGLSLAIYYLIPRKTQWIALLLFSAAFFLASSVPYTGLYLLACVMVTWLCARSIVRHREAEHPRRACAVLILGVILNLALLGTLKYANFFLSLFQPLFPNMPSLALLAPIGISFYTFQAVGLLLDAYWGISTPQIGFFKTALFIGYYPQLTSGPIARFGQMENQLYIEHPFDYQNLTFGLQRMLWGVFKKLVISARLGILVDTIYGDIEQYPGLYIWLAAALFMFQLYTDFSGCMDIIIGASECYGIVLPENFRTPFFSRSVQEFWQRWHITLGGWMRDYLLYPLMRSKALRGLTKLLKNTAGKKAAKQIPSWLAMLCVWFAMGIWHGGGWNYILGMGIWFWLCIVLSQALEPLFKKIIALLRINTESFSWRLFQRIRVFILASIGNMFFRLHSLTNTFATMKAGISVWNSEIFFDGSLFKLGLDRPDFWVMVLSLGVLLLISVIQEKESVRERLARQNLVFRWVILYALIFGILILGMYGPGYDAQSFIYENF